MAKISGLLFFELYYSFRLYFVPKNIHNMIRLADLPFLFASHYNKTEFRMWFYLIYTTNFSAVHVDQARRGNIRADYSPGSTDQGVDYFMYYPYHSFLVDVSSPSIE